MDAPSLIAIDLAKTMFHLHGVTATGAVLFRRKLRRRPAWTAPPSRVA